MSRKPSLTPIETKSDLDASSANSDSIAGFFDFDRLETNFRTIAYSSNILNKNISLGSMRYLVFGFKPVNSDEYFR